MLFSEHNDAIVYENHAGGLLKVCGEGHVCKADTDVSPNHRHPDWEEYSVISLDKGITAVGEGFLETFVNMETLIISRTVTNIEMTNALERLFGKNKVDIKGWYDTFGEEFALRNHLPFSHADILIGWSEDPRHYSNTKLNLCFDSRKGPFLLFDEYTPGSSAGSYGGGTYEKKLLENFYVGMTLEIFAETLPDYQEPILKSEDLKYYFEKANGRIGKA